MSVQNQFFAPGDEFAHIERMFAPDHFARDGRGLGDDAYVWDRPENAKPLVVTTDASAEGVHYRLDFTTPERALRKALLANLSDINAMGGRSRKVFFNLGARRDWPAEVYDHLGAALRAMEAEYGFTVAGGDTLKLPSTSFFGFTVLGEVDGRPLLRSACRPGHRVYVSGTLGGSAAGLASLLKPSGGWAPSSESELVVAHLDPTPPLALGPLLASFLQDGGDREVAAIDISDGLSSELAHLARQSGCALRIEAAHLPPHPALGDSFASLAPAARLHVLHGGEEYQLLFTGAFSADELAQLRAFARVTDIGSVHAGEGVTLVDNGVESPLIPKGFVHGG